MSIHTILSQEIVSDKTNRLYVRTKKYPNGGLIMGEEVDKFLKRFATRIVEEAKREERGRIIHLAETYKTYYNPINDAQNKGKHMAMDDLIKELQKEEHDKQI